MNDKLREIRETLNTYHASKIGSERYAAKYEIVDNAIDVADTLSAEIDRLTAENAELKRQNSSWGEYVADKDKSLDRAEAENAELKRRLGAAIEDINSYGATCPICKKSKDCDHEPEDGCFEYKGLQGKDGQKDE